jgi:heptosyltransferase-1
MSDILIIKTSSLGDVVHQMPAITDAARALPGLRMSWVVEEAFAPLARLHPSVSEVIPVATRRWRSHLASRATWREIGDFNTHLREPEFDKVIDTQGLIRSAIIARLAQGERHGYDAQSIREPLASRFYDVRHSVSRLLHAVARNRALTALSLGYQPVDEIDYGLIKPARGADAPYALLLLVPRACRRNGARRIGSRPAAGCRAAGSNRCCRGAPTPSGRPPNGCRARFPEAACCRASRSISLPA